MSDERTIPNVTRGSVLALFAVWGFAVVWCGFILAMFLIWNSIANKPSRPIMLAAGAPFVLGGTLLVGLAVTITRRMIRYRSLVLHLDTLPGVVGGRLAGRLEGAEGLLRRGMTIRLACSRRAAGEGPDDLLWENIIDLPAGSTTSVPFRFDVPYECEPSGNEDGRIYWQLTMQTDAGGYAGSFEVPLRRTAQSSPEITEKSLRPRTVAQPQYSRVRVARAADGAIELRFPRPSWEWKWYLFTLVTAAAALAYAVVAPAVLILLAIIQLGLLFAPRRVRADRHELSVRFASPLRPAKRLAPSSIADFVPRYSGSAQRYYVDVLRDDGTTYTWLMMAAADKREAEWLAYELRRQVLGGTALASP